MKLHILSDLHLGSGAFERPEIEADVVVLAGDIARPRESVPWASGFGKPVLYVPGNHEFYGGSIDGTVQDLTRACAGTQVHVLDDTEMVIGGVRFLGSTLWTDFELFDEPARAAAKAEAGRLIRDFSRIRLAEAGQAVFTPEDSAALFKRHANWLRARLDYFDVATELDRATPAPQPTKEQPTPRKPAPSTSVEDAAWVKAVKARPRPAAQQAAYL